MQFKNVQKEVSKSVKVAKRNFERNLAKNRKANSKAFYSHIKKNTSNRVTVGPLRQGDEIVADNAQMASVINDFFVQYLQRKLWEIFLLSRSCILVRIP